MSSSPLDPKGVAATTGRGSPYRSSIARVDALIDSGLSLSGNERNCAFLNGGGGRFATASAVSGLDFKDDARALAAVDWDGDGDLDVWTTNRTAPMLRFARNGLASTNRWLAIKLAAASGNRDAIGARVTVRFAGGGKVERELAAGSGFLTGGSRWLHFGLGKASIEGVSVRWPDGQQELFKNIEPGSRWLLQRGKGTGQRVEATKASLPDVAAEPFDVGGAVAARAGARPFLPRLPFQTFSGAEMHAGGTSDQLTLVNLWATWCAPCVAELESFAGAKEGFDAAAIRVLPLAVDGLVEGGERGDPAAFYRKLELPFAGGIASPELVRRINDARTASWGIRWELPVPSSVLLDRQGRMLALYAGAVEPDRILEDAALATLGPMAAHDASLPFDGYWIERPERLSPLPRALELMQRGAVADAHEFANRCAGEIQSHPEYGRLMTWIGGDLIVAGNAPDGIAALEAGVEASPDDITALNNLAWQLAAHRDPALRDGPRAVKWAERARDLTSGDNPAILDTLAAAYAQNGEFERALETAATALSKASGNSALQGSLERAIRRYRQGLRPASE